MGIFYKSLRVGQNGKLFYLWKFRTMIPNNGEPTASIDDPRLTKLGRWLRRYKLDEIPAIINVMRGEIALCGSRPDVPSEIESLDEETKKVVLSRKPGFFSPATIWDFHEDEVLRNSKNPHQDYCEKIKPVKYALNVWYTKNRSLWLDLKVIFATLLKFIHIDRVRIRVYPEVYDKDFFKGTSEKT